MTPAKPQNRWLALRKRLNMDQSEFAEIALTSRSTISRVETGASQLKYSNLRALEITLGAPICVLLGDDRVPAPPSWYLEYLTLSAKEQRVVTEVIRATISAIKTF